MFHPHMSVTLSNLLFPLWQVTTLLDKQLVEEAVLLAETIAAVEASKNPAAAEE